MSASDFTVHLIRGHEVLRVDDTRFVYRDDAGKRHPERFLSFAALPIDGVNRLVLLIDPEPYGTDVAGVVNMDATAIAGADYVVLVNTTEPVWSEA